MSSELELSEFAGCCGAVIIHNFPWQPSFPERQAELRGLLFGHGEGVSYEYCETDEADLHKHSEKWEEEYFYACAGQRAVYAILHVDQAEKWGELLTYYGFKTHGKHRSLGTGNTLIHYFRPPKKYRTPKRWGEAGDEYKLLNSQ